MPLLPSSQALVETVAKLRQQLQEVENEDIDETEAEAADALSTLIRRNAKLQARCTHAPRRRFGEPANASVLAASHSPHSSRSLPRRR